MVKFWGVTDQQMHETENMASNCIFLNPTDKNKILKVIGELKTKQRAGNDNISPKIIKKCKNSIAHPLVSIVIWF